MLFAPHQEYLEYCQAAALEWRLHTKILPSWLAAREPGRLTYRVQRSGEEEEEREEIGAVEEQEEEEGGILDRWGRRRTK